MRGLPLVVGLQSGFQIVGYTDIALSRVQNTLKEVGVFHIGEVKRKKPAYAGAMAGRLRFLVPVLTNKMAL